MRCNSGHGEELSAACGCTPDSWGPNERNSRPKAESRGVVLGEGQQAHPVDPISTNVSLYSSVDHKPGSQFCEIFLCCYYEHYVRLDSGQSEYFSSELPLNS